MSGSGEGGFAGGLEKIYDLAYGGMNGDGPARPEFSPSLHDIFTIISRHIQAISW